MLYCPEYDLSDTQWSFVSAVLESKARLGRRRCDSPRVTFDAITYRDRNNCSWSKVPRIYGKTKTIYHYFRIWSKNGDLLLAYKAARFGELHERQAEYTWLYNDLEKQLHAAIASRRTIPIADWGDV